MDLQEEIQSESKNTKKQNIISALVIGGLLAVSIPLFMSLRDSISQTMTSSESSMNQELIAMQQAENLNNGTYTLTDTNVRPMPSVVYDAQNQNFTLQVNTKNDQTQTVTEPMSNVRILTTTGSEKVIVKNGMYDVYLSKNAQISETAPSNGGSGIVKGVIIGVLLHHVLS